MLGYHNDADIIIKQYLWRFNDRIIDENKSSIGAMPLTFI